MATRSRPLGGPCSWFGGHPSPGFGGNKKAAAPVRRLRPRDLVFGPALPLVRSRETSDPILRTAGPPAHTHVPGDLGVSHGPRMVAQDRRLVNRCGQNTTSRRLHPARFGGPRPTISVAAALTVLLPAAGVARGQRSRSRGGRARRPGGRGPTNRQQLRHPRSANARFVGAGPPTSVRPAATLLSCPICWPRANGRQPIGERDVPGGPHVGIPATEPREPLGLPP